MLNRRNAFRPRRTVLALCAAVLLHVTPAQGRSEHVTQRVVDAAMGAGFLGAGLWGANLAPTQFGLMSSATALRFELDTLRSIPMAWAVASTFLFALGQQGDWPGFLPRAFGRTGDDAAFFGTLAIIATDSVIASLQEYSHQNTSNATDLRFLSQFVQGYGVVPAAVGRAWDPVREYTGYLTPLQIQRPFTQIAPIWAADQAFGHIIDFSFIGLMHSMTYAIGRDIPVSNASRHEFYRGHDTLLDVILADFAVSAAGNVAVSVCSLAMAYARPMDAGSRRNRFPCHFARQGARTTVRALLAWQSSAPDGRWQAAFWQREKWLVTQDLAMSFLRHRWWRNWEDAYSGGSLGALSDPEQQPPMIPVQILPANPGED
jgi:hypothetical protein